MPASIVTGESSGLGIPPTPARVYQSTAPLIVWEILDPSGNPFNLAGKELRFVAYVVNGQTPSSVLQYDTSSSGSITIHPTTYTLTAASPSPWTVPSDALTAIVTCMGAGGGGGDGGSLGENFGGGGGGGGATSQTTNIALTPGTTIPFSVGVGGAGSDGTGSGYGITGGDTSWNGGAILAKGGMGGVDEVGNGAGGAGGLSSAGVGVTKFSGGTGGTANITSSQAGGGGSAFATGNGGNGTNSSAGNGLGPGGVAGSPGVIPGGGGGGGLAGNAGASGANGQITIAYGVESNVTVRLSTTDTATAQSLLYDLWDITDNIVIAHGTLEITAASKTFP